MIKLLWQLARFKSNEKKSFAKLQKLQKKKLYALLTYAYEHSDYYRKRFEAASITAENLKNTPLSAFPTMDKATFLKNFDDLITVKDVTLEDIRRFDAEEAFDRRTYNEKYHVVHSSGSTGKPGYFIYDASAWNSMLLGILRGALWKMSMPQIFGLLTSGPRIAYIAATDGRYAGAMAVGDGIDGIGAQQCYIDIKAPLAQWVKQIQEFKPNILIGYPSAIKILAELIDRGEVKVNIIRVISCGEPLGSSLRNYLEKIFAATVINFYGASESLALGVETDPAEGIILFDDMNVLEATEDGLYLTCLYNFAQPLIRYRLSDRLILQPPEAESRFPFTRARGLLGRSEDLLWFEDPLGNREFLHPLAIEGFCIEGLLDYQFRQNGKASFEMLAEVEETALKEQISREMYRQMKDILAEKNLAYVAFSIQFVEQIMPDAQTGKKKLIDKTYLQKGGLQDEKGIIAGT